MSDTAASASGGLFTTLRRVGEREKVWLAAAGLLAAIALYSPAQGLESLLFTANNTVDVLPFLVLSIGVAGYASATGADGLIARAFSGSEATMVIVAALAGGLSPFCSCGVIPLIAALLTMGVPLSAVMAFWLASPVMDPSMFALTVGVLDLEFAIAKTLSAVGLGLLGGYVVYFMARSGQLQNVLREGVGNGGCGASKVRTRKDVVWAFWKEKERTAKFTREGVSTGLFLLKWLVLAYVLESLMVAYIPADSISHTLGGSGFLPIATATLVGVPAYLNGYAALPLVSGLLDQGMSAGAGLAFLVAGGVSSVPAAIAVWALVKKRVFALYLGLALLGSFACGVLFQLYLMV